MRVGKWALLLCCLFVVSGCGVNIVLPGRGGTFCGSDGKCSSSGSSQTKTTTGDPSKSTTEPVPTDPAKPPAPTEPAPTPTRLCEGDADCEAGQVCTKDGQGGTFCEGTPCTKRSRDDCRRMRGVCYLEWRKEDTYRCRGVQNACEKLDKKACLAQSSCGWDPGHCYCPEGVPCACGGGPSDNCQDPNKMCDDPVSCMAFCLKRFQCCPSNGICPDAYIECSQSPHPNLPSVCR